MSNYEIKNKFKVTLNLLNIELEIWEINCIYTIKKESIIKTDSHFINISIVSTIANNFFTK